MACCPTDYYSTAALFHELVLCRLGARNLGLFKFIAKLGFLDGNFVMMIFVVSSFYIPNLIHDYNAGVLTYCIFLLLLTCVCVDASCHELIRLPSCTLVYEIRCMNMDDDVCK